MQKKLFSVFSFLVCVFALCSCRTKDILLFLNWGEYIDESLIEEFEEMYDVSVVLDLADSNEIFYAKLSSGTTVYDVICPSDYTVIKMYQNGYLSPIDMAKITNYDLNNRCTGVKGITATMEEEAPGVSNYFVPYLWGTWGIMYSTLVEGLKEAVVNNPNNEWGSLFNRDSLPAGTKVGMYESSQHCYFGACKYLGLDNMVELNDNDLDKVYDLLKDMKYNAYATDTLKKDIVSKNLDLGFMWTGDFLYYYCEQMVSVVCEAYDNDNSIDIIEMIEALLLSNHYTSPSNEDYTVGFDLFIPEDTIAFCDNLVIPKHATHKDLAHKFIDFMCSKEGAYANTYYVDYNTPFVSTYDELVELKNSELNIAGDSISDDEASLIYDICIGYAFEKYYPRVVENEKGYKGTILATFQRKYIDRLNSIFNNSKPKKV